MAESGSTWGDLQARIVSDLGNRTDLAQDILNALTESVEYFQPRVFLATEAEQQWVSTNAWPAANAQTVVLPPQFESIDSVYANITGDYLRLIKLSQRELEDLNLQIPPDIGPPIYYSIFTQLMWFWPIPDQAYPLKAIYDSLIPLPGTDDISNFWTVDAEAMIRHRAVGILRATIIRNQDNGLNDFALAQKEYYKLKQRVADVEAPRRARPIHL